MFMKGASLFADRLDQTDHSPCSQTHTDHGDDRMEIPPHPSLHTSVGDGQGEHWRNSPHFHQPVNHTFLPQGKTFPSCSHSEAPVTRKALVPGTRPPSSKDRSVISFWSPTLFHQEVTSRERRKSHHIELPGTLTEIPLPPMGPPHGNQQPTEDDLQQ